MRSASSIGWLSHTSFAGRHSTNSSRQDHLWSYSDYFKPKAVTMRLLRGDPKLPFSPLSFGTTARQLLSNAGNLSQGRLFVFWALGWQGTSQIYSDRRPGPQLPIKSWRRAFRNHGHPNIETGRMDGLFISQWPVLFFDSRHPPPW